MTEKMPLRVLVVDDSEAITKTLGWTLEALGYDVRVGHDGFQALAVARSFLPHVILLDISLPGMSGYEVCQHLRAEPALKKSIFIAQSGWAKPEHKDHSKVAAFDHYLVKPLDITALQDLLSSVQAQAVA
jgi:CheY-like chemotaxis protein